MSIKQRPYYYGNTLGSRTVYVYTEEEWGIGAGDGGGGPYNLIRSFYFSLVITVLLFLPATLGCLFLGIIAIIELPLMAVVMLFFGLLFGLGVLQGYFNITQEWRGRKARKLKGLPKPWLRVHDDHAYEWFLKHPSPHIPLTLEYFPDCRQLQEQAKAFPTPQPPGNVNS